MGGKYLDLFNVVNNVLFFLSLFVFSMIDLWIYMLFVICLDIFMVFISGILLCDNILSVLVIWDVLSFWLIFFNRGIFSI